MITMTTPITAATAGHGDAPYPIPLPLGRYRLTFEAQTPVHLPPFAGSAWRGALGHALKEAVCVTRLTRCEGCLLLRSCVYPYIFETPLPPESERMTRYPTVPHPYVLEAEGGERAIGEPLRLGLTLVGRANAHLPYLVHPLAQAGQGGVGRGRGRLGLSQVEQEAEPGGGEWHRVHLPGEGLSALPPTPSHRCRNG
jgi:hypothetical protein